MTELEFELVPAQNESNGAAQSEANRILGLVRGVSRQHSKVKRRMLLSMEFKVSDPESCEV